MPSASDRPDGNTLRHTIEVMLRMARGGVRFRLGVLPTLASCATAGMLLHGLGWA
jgi:hypothetical protein